MRSTQADAGLGLGRVDRVGRVKVFNKLQLVSILFVHLSDTNMIIQMQMRSLPKGKVPFIVPHALSLLQGCLSRAGQTQLDHISNSCGKHLERDQNDVKKGVQGNVSVCQ